MAYSCMTFVMDFTGYNPILTVTCSRWTISIIVTFVVSDCGMGMWCVVVVVLAMADASVSVVNGTDDISLLVMAGVVSTIGGCGAWFGSFLKIWKGRNSYCWRKTLKYVRLPQTRYVSITLEFFSKENIKLNWLSMLLILRCLFLKIFS